MTRVTWQESHDKKAHDKSHITRVTWQRITLQRITWQESHNKSHMTKNHITKNHMTRVTWQIITWQESRAAHAEARLLWRVTPKRLWVMKAMNMSKMKRHGCLPCLSRELYLSRDMWAIPCHVLVTWLVRNSISDACNLIHVGRRCMCTHRWDLVYKYME